MSKGCEMSSSLTSISNDLSHVKVVHKILNLSFKTITHNDNTLCHLIRKYSCTHPRMYSLTNFKNKNTENTLCHKKTLTHSLTHYKNTKTILYKKIFTPRTRTEITPCY